MKKIIMLLLMVSISYQCSKNKEKVEAVIDEAPKGELKIEDIKIGTGEVAEKEKKIVVHYKGWIDDGTEFANSYNTGNPLIVTLGIGDLIAGWEQGLVGMKEGGVRKLIVPPHLGYGKRGVRKIPPNSTLYFEVKLVNILH